MAVRLNPYLSFRDNAREAMEFYHSVFGGELNVSTFADFHASDEPDEQNLIMHGMLEGENDVVLMGADTPKSMDYVPGAGFSVSLSGDDEAALRRYWDGLSADGEITMPLEQAPWGDTFGSCTDKFGVNWLVNITGTPAEA
jgi:PhnB protein